jgi:hypothetical protein
MTRVGYDADTERYTFQDANGYLYESAPGNRYGNLTRSMLERADLESFPNDLT